MMEKLLVEVHLKKLETIFGGALFLFSSSLNTFSIEYFAKNHAFLLWDCYLFLLC